jgi:hypothetical protein
MFGWSLARDSGYLASISSTGALKAGNLTTTMDTTGLTSLAGVAGQDDVGVTFPVNFDFFFFGTNYGNGLNSGIYWNTNNVIGFGTAIGTITWVANTGRGVLIGNTDRRTNTFWYSGTLSSSGFSYIKCLLFGQNIYNDGIPNAMQFQIRMFRSSSVQYIEVSCKQAPSTAGVYNITNGTAFQNTYGSFTNMTANQSFVLQSDGNGNNWTFYNNYYVNLP